MSAIQSFTRMLQKKFVRSVSVYLFVRSVSVNLFLSFPLSSIYSPIKCIIISFLFHIFQGPEVRSGDLPQPINLVSGQGFTFTIKRGVGTEDCVSVNYDDFVNDVEVGDMLLVDGMVKCYAIFL